MYDSRMIANETIAERLIRLAKAKFGDAHGFRRRLSESSGISESPLSKILGGSTRPTLPTLRKLAQALDVTLLSLTDPDAVPASTPTPEPLPFRVPLCGVVAAGLGEDEEFPPDLWLDVPGECRGANAAYQVRGLSMREVGILDGITYLSERTQNRTTEPSLWPGSRIGATWSSDWNARARSVFCTRRMERSVHDGPTR